MRASVRGAGWLLAVMLWSACGAGPLEDEGTEAPSPGLAAPGEAPESEPAIGTEEAALTTTLRTRWVRTHERVEFRQMAFDSSGNLYVALSYHGPATLTGVPLPWNGDPDDYHSGVAKFRPDNTLAWVRGWGPARVSRDIAYANITGFAVTPGGTVYVGGEAQQDGLRIGGRTLDNGTFLVRLSSGGTLQWARTTRPEPNTDFTFVSFAAHPAGGFYALGNFRHFGQYPYQLMLIRYRSDGAAAWGNIYEQAEGSSSANPMRVAADEAGNAYVSGYSYGSVSFGGPTGPTELSPFVFSTTSAGRHRWTRFLSVPDVGFADGLAVRDGRVVVAVGASFDGAFLLGLTTGLGTERWRVALGNVGNEMTVSTGARNEVLLSVASGDASALGVPRSRPTSNLWNTTSFVARVRRTDGRVLGAANLESSPDDDRSGVYATSCAVSNAGTLAVAGRFDGTVDFGMGPRTNANASFVLRALP
ncbi:hypothetical protein FGE12_25630 [Aggregicoccus sp. 17bor-14]|uniref:hypothetical protein n=1 Tax=Myxococcaceae TaxID=31 RepID=UPI00129CEAE9|nr:MULTISPECIES: hypothetical protein [Myxococcaceae]MBF5045815.1 hypothetical protein [Simulacricoccus sp. 17bor-14]MRI91550.1 hypothetical protein [Aggregicoccus sp. 17bor-14]